MQNMTKIMNTIWCTVKALMDVYAFDYGRIIREYVNEFEEAFLY